MDINFTYFIFILIAVVVGVIVIKKITGNDFCLTAKYFQYIFAQNTG